MNRERIGEHVAGTKLATSAGVFRTDRRISEVHSRIPSLSSYLKALPPGSRVLEIGIGTGAALRDLRNHYPHLAISGTNLFERQRPTGKTKGVVKAEGTALPFKANSFDLIFSAFVLPYVVNKARFLEEVHRVLKPEGKAAIDAPHPNHNFIIQRGKKRLGIDEYFLNHPQVKISETTRTDRVIEITKKRPKLRLPIKLSLKHSQLTKEPTVPHFTSTYREVKTKGTK